MKRIVMNVIMAAFIITSIFAGGKQDTDEKAPSVRTVEFWHTLSGVNGAAIDKIAQNFNTTVGKQKGIFIKSVYQGNDNSEKLKTLAQAGDSKNFPDVCQIVGAGIPSALAYPEIVPVQDMLDSGKGTVAPIEPNMLRAYTYKNRLIGMPVSCSSILLYYNKDMFREAGLDPEKPPKTIAEMANCISKLMVKKGNTVERYGLNVAVRRYQFSNWICGQGKYAFFGDNEGGRTAPMTKVVFGEDGTLRKFLTEWDKICKTGGYKAVEDDINEEFALPVFGMAIMSTARIGKIKNLVQNSFDWTVAPFPLVNANDTGRTSVGGSCVVMFNPHKDPEQVAAAWEFVQYMVSPEVQFEFHKNTGYIPVNKKCYELPAAKEWFRTQPMYKVAIDQIHASHPYVQEPFDIINWEIDSVIKTHMLNFAKGIESIDQCHDAIVNECNAKLAAYHKANK